MKNIVTPQYYAVNGAVMSINQDNLDRPGPGPGHANINQDNLDMPGTGPGQASINQDNLDMPGPGSGHAMT